MARITITCNIPDDLADPSHDMGVTDAGYQEIAQALMALGAEDIDVERG